MSISINLDESAVTLVSPEVSTVHQSKSNGTDVVDIGNSIVLNNYSNAINDQEEEVVNLSQDKGSTRNR